MEKTEEKNKNHETGNFETENTEIENTNNSNDEKMNDDNKEENIFSKAGKKIKSKACERKYKMELNKSIKKQFNENSQKLKFIDQGIKSLGLKIMAEIDEENKKMIMLGENNIKNNTLLKNKDGDIFKILSKVSNDETRTFEFKGKEYTRRIEVYEFKEV